MIYEALEAISSRIHAFTIIGIDFGLGMPLTTSSARPCVSTPKNLRVQHFSDSLACLHDEIFQAHCSRIAGWPKHRTILPSCANLLINARSLLSSRFSLETRPTSCRADNIFSLWHKFVVNGLVFFCARASVLKTFSQKVCKRRNFPRSREEREVKDEKLCNCICKSKKGGQHQQLRLQTGKLCNQSGIEIARRLRSANSVQRK